MRALKKITEETMIKRQIKSWLSAYGWYHFPVLQGLGAHKGVPDIIALKDGMTLFIEVKKQKGKLSEHQEQFKILTESAGGIYIVARSFEDVQQVIKAARLIIPDGKDGSTLSLTPVKGMRWRYGG